MSLRDSRNLVVSTDNAASLEGFERGLHLLNGFYNDPLAVIDKVLANDPDFVMGHCFRAGLFLLSTDKHLEGEVRSSVLAAEIRARQANARERGHISALHAWLNGDLHRAIELYDRVLVEYPRDLLALQIAHQGDFFLGQSSMLRDRVARVLPAWDETVPGHGFVLGMYAFGLEEMNEFRRAEEAGRKALDISRRDPWAVHAVAHVMEMEGRIADGIAWLRSREADWAPENAFAFHNWWHLGLYHLDRGETDEVLRVYDTGIRPQPCAVVLEGLDASAMLWRLHLRGIEATERWEAIADFWEPHAEDAYYAFNDLHVAMAFAASGRAAPMRALLGALERRAQGRGSNGAMTREVGLPACRAIAAFADGNYETAVELLLPIRSVAQRAGGSNAQRDVLSLTLLEAALRAKKAALAQALAAERTALKPTSAFNWRATARALAQLGDRSGADRARDRAAALAA
jgi:tetratricopeptide (TPR) repeat protein